MMPAQGFLATAIPVGHCTATDWATRWGWALFEASPLYGWADRFEEERGLGQLAARIDAGRAVKLRQEAQGDARGGEGT